MLKDSEITGNKPAEQLDSERKEVASAAVTKTGYAAQFSLRV